MRLRKIMKKENLKNYAIALLEATENLSSEESDKEVENFLKFLVKENKFKKIDRIIVEIEECEKKKQGIKTVEIVSARKFSKEVLKEINRIFDCELEIKETI